MNYVKISLGIFAILAASRFIPHPPNFTSLIALSFYVPAIFGFRFLPLVIISFVATDILIGFHSLTLFTWGSVLFIGLIPKYLNHTILKRISGALTGSLLFFIITNLGVWLIGSHSDNSLNLIDTYFIALPFFGYNLISTIIYSFIFEIVYKIIKTKLIFSN
mgnify:CR=1 FL=1|tara:strand:+ start:2004 stop:2489 length:486 start_codon:yes stop_codon:yes gene_type:complete